MEKDIKLAIAENYLEPERDIKKTIKGKIQTTCILVKDSTGKKVYSI